MARLGERFEARFLFAVALAASAWAVCGCPSESAPSIARATHFLQAQQVAAPYALGPPSHPTQDFPGDWPQYFHFEGAPEIQFREVSPFMVAFIHDSLNLLTPDNAQTLGLRPADIEAARTMRRRATAFIRTFAAPDTAPDAGTFGFWPIGQDGMDRLPLLSALAFNALQGPVLGGTRTPLNVRFYPSQLAIPTDADVTAAAYVTMLDDWLLGDGPAVSGPVDRVFADWRDTGTVPRRFNPPWLPPASGAFLTWLNYRSPPDLSIPNDVDLVVNANVLYTLARFGKLDTPGVAEAVALIDSAVRQGLHHTRPEQISLYYPDNFAFHFCVSRAYRRGPVPALATTVRTLAAELEADAITRPGGEVYWDNGDPALNTAFALLTLLNAGGDSPLIPQAIRYLRSTQNPVCGAWNDGVFFVGRTDGGPQINWTSTSFTTGMALEALARYELDVIGKGRR